MNLRPFLALLLATPAAAQTVHVVDVAGGGDYPEIQDAVNAAADGDTVLVRTGSYYSVVVHDKDLVIAADTGASVQTGTVRVRNLSAGKTVVLAGLDARGQGATSGSSGYGLWLVSCEGSVRLQQCSFQGADAPGTNDVHDGWAGARVEGCQDVHFSACDVRGGQDSGTWLPPTIFDFARAGHGLWAEGSRLSLVGCSLRGADGAYPASYNGAIGGDGANVTDGHLVSAQCSFQGGHGAYANYCWESGHGGQGLILTAGPPSTAQSLEDVRAGGLGAGPAGCGLCSTCTAGDDGLALYVGPGWQWTEHGGAGRRLSTPAVSRSNTVVLLRVSGEVGDEVRLYASDATGFRPLSDPLGVLLLAGVAMSPAQGGAGSSLPLPLKLPAGAQGPIPASGVLTIPLELIELPPGEQVRRVHLQAVTRDASGQRTLTDATSLVVVRCDIPATDCNLNGVADGCDIAAGTSRDCDVDGVPDECQVLPDCDANGVPDACDIADGTHADCDGNAVPDLCELVDCNANGVLDVCDIADGTSEDANGNWIADECELLRLYVNRQAPPGGDGSSWATAFDDLHDALNYEGEPLEIWVAKGTYKPAPPGGSHYESFVLPPRVAVYGGFAGDETSLDQRDPELHKTRLSGDLDGDDLPGFIFLHENSFSVVRCNDADGQRLDGFYIMRGYSKYSATSSPSHSNSGAGLYVEGEVGEPLTVANCVFLENYATTSGGGLCAYLSTPRVVNCRFVGNHAEGTAAGGGGGLAVYDADAWITNCVFSGNETGPEGWGGAMYLHNDELYGETTHAWIHDCTVYGNLAQYGAGIYLRGTAGSFGPMIGHVRNSVLWGNVALNQTGESAQATAGFQHTQLDIAFTCIEGLDQHAGSGNIGLDPLWPAPDGPDGEVGTLDDDLRLISGSPCVDAGSNGALPADLGDVDLDRDLAEELPLDLDGAPRRADDAATPDTGSGTSPIVDLGAYELPGG